MKPVLRGFVEDGGLLENTEAAGASCEKVEDLPGYVLVLGG
jgi:hypothetical protein